MSNKACDNNYKTNEKIISIVCWWKHLKCFDASCPFKSFISMFMFKNIINVFT
jgi:hypothetical protein